VTPKSAILLVLTGLLVGGVLLFCRGGELRNEALKSKTTAGRGNTDASRGLDNPGSIANPFSALSGQTNPESTNGSLNRPKNNQSVASPGDIQQNSQSEQNSSERLSESNPLQLIEDYMTAWSGNNRGEIQALWEQISHCPPCLQRIQELLMNQSLPQGMLLELTYQIIELGDDSMLPLFDHLLQPSVDVNTRTIVARQMLKDGRPMYVKKLFDVLQQADLDGYHDYAAKHAWMISGLRNPQGIVALFDVISGRSGASQEFSNHVSTVFNNTLLGIQQEGMTEAMANYYLTADTTEQQNLWGVLSLHSESLMLLANKAYQDGDLNRFRKFSQTISEINSVGAVEHMLKLVSKADYSQEYFIGIMRASTQRFNNLEVLHKLEDYLRNPDVDMRSRIVAAEGLLAVKDMDGARYILEKALNSSSYEDAEIVAYIGARL